MGDRGMPDREKVIRGLEVCTVNGTSCNGCPYYGLVETIGCVNSIMEDALALLREQEAVEPEREHSGGGITWWNVCGACRTAINPNDKYCHECGRRVKWNDAE